MTGSVVLPVKAVAHERADRRGRAGRADLHLPGRPPDGLLGYTPNGGVEPTDFLVTAALVFALSTDYGVFLLGPHQGGARRRRSASARRSRSASPRTGAVVTAAAILLAVAIGAFCTSSISFIQQIGVATASGVLIDAFVVRTLLVPSLMGLLGKWNWWSPTPLRRLHDRARSHLWGSASDIGPTARLRSGHEAGSWSSTSGSLPASRPPWWPRWPTAPTTGRETTPLAIAVAVVAVLPTLTRHRHPGWSLAACMALLYVVLAVVDVHFTAPFSSMLCGYSLALVADRRRVVLAGLALVPAVVGAILLFSDHRTLLDSEIPKNLAFVAAPLLLRCGSPQPPGLPRGPARPRRDGGTYSRRGGPAQGRRGTAPDRPRRARRRGPRDGRDQRAGGGGRAPARPRPGAGPPYPRGHREGQRRGARDLRSTLGMLRADAAENEAAPVRPAQGLRELGELGESLRTAGIEVDLDVDPATPRAGAGHLHRLPDRAGGAHQRASGTRAAGTPGSA